MATADFPITKMTAMRRWSGSPSPTRYYQSEGEQHLIGYLQDDGSDAYASLVELPLNWSALGIKQLTKAELLVNTTGLHHGNSAVVNNIKCALLKTAWSEAGGGGEGNFNSIVPVLTTNANYVSYGGPKTSVVPKAFSIDITKLVMGWAPKSVKGPTGAAGAALANHGFIMVPSGTYLTAPKRSFTLASVEHPTTALRPVLRLTYTSIIGPGAAIADAPYGSIPDYVGENFIGEFEPPGLGITMASFDLQVRLAGGAQQWEVIRPASKEETASGQFVVPLPASLKSATAYEWAVKIKDSRGVWTIFSPWAAFRIDTTPPALTVLGPSGSFSTLNGVRFRATYSDPEANLLTSLRIQVRSTTAPGAPLWDSGDSFWDTGDTAARKSERDTKTISRLYEGEGLLPGGYSFRMRATDRLGGVSPWVYGTFSLTKGYEPRPGTTNFLTGYGRDRYDFRVRIFAMGANRGPGKLVAEFVDAKTVGASEYYNSPGEFYFTVPVEHPQASVVEPFQTHYSLEVYRGEGWYPVSYGLMTDYDATDNEAVFYGIDYVGLLSLLSDERFNPADSPNKPVESGGSYYNNWRISEIIRNQLQLAVDTVNSPVGFITVATPSSWPEFISIHSTFKERLSFISGLIESHRAGTGVRSRLVCEKDISGGFTFRLLDAPGVDRANIVAEYGGLIQGYHIVPFGAWGTRVHGIGRTTDGIKPFYDRETAPGIDETLYGSFPQVRMWADLADANDLKRRTLQAARNVAKVGKRMGLGIRVASLDIKDGWDVCDSIVVNLQHGIVDTSRFGSGYWTIWGWTWEWSENKADLTLSLLPREDSVAPNPDLLPSSPILDFPEWGVGSGPPAADAPHDWWLDSDTGAIWEKQPDGTWTNTGDSLSGAPGPPGATGPPGPPGGSGILLGNYRYNTARGPSPATGRVRLNAAPVAGVPNLLLLNEQEVAGDNRLAYLGMIGVGDTVWVDDGSGSLFKAVVTGTPTDMGVYWQVPFTPAGSVEPADNAAITVSDVPAPASVATDTTPPAVPTGLVLTTGSILQTDGSLRPFLRGDWTAVTDSDLANYEVEAVPASQYIPITGGSLGWYLDQRAGTAVLPPGGYLVGVTDHGVNGGETRAFEIRVDLAAGMRLYVTQLNSNPQVGLTGSHSIFMIPSTTGAEVPVWYADTTANEVELAFVPSGRPMPTVSTAINWTDQGLIQLKPHANNFVQPNVLGGWVHAARVRAVDKSGNRSGFGTSASLATATDGVAPHIPTALSAAPGYNLVGLTWSRSDATDLDRYQVRYRPVGAPDWIGPLNVYANMTIINDLDLHDVVGNFAQYEFAVRAVDRSGNVEVSAGPPQVIGNVVDVTIGWTSAVQVTMSAIPAESIAVEELFANYAYLINVTADQITTGHLDITPGPNDPNSIIMWNDPTQTQMVGYWSPSGWYIIDPANRTRAIRGKNGVLSFTSAAWYPGNPAGNGQVWQTPDASWTTGIGPDGISADIITLGGLPGGHNRLLNSGFELRPNSVTANQTFDTAAEWDAPLAGAVNKNTALTILQQLKYQYTDV